MVKEMVKRYNFWSSFFPFTFQYLSIVSKYSGIGLVIVILKNPPPPLPPSLISSYSNVKLPKAQKQRLQ